MNLTDSRFDIPDLANLIIPAQTVLSRMKALELHDFLIQQPGIPCLPVEEEGQIVGVIYSRDFLKTMSRAFMRELSSRMNVGDFINRYFFRAQAEDKVTDVLTALLTHDPKLECDSVVVFLGEELAGIVTVANLLLKISETQHHLLDQMELLSSRLKHEVNISAQLQRELMPNKELIFNGFHVSGMLVTSTEVGGDLFDYFIIENRFLVLAMGDVSGHGVPAGMVVSAAKGCLRTLPNDILLQPAQFLRHLNYAIFATGLMQRLMTFFYIIIDTKKQEARYANAGHNFPFYYSTAKGQWLQLEDSAGLPLGIDENEIYHQATLRLSQNDRLFLYTDGLVEEVDAEDIQFGYHRVAEKLNELATATPHVMITGMLEVLTSYANGKTFEDDVTLLGLQVMEPPPIAKSTVALFKSAEEQHENSSVEKLLHAYEVALVDGAELVDTDLDNEQAPVPFMTQGFFKEMAGSLPHFPWSHAPVLWAGDPLSHQFNQIMQNSICRILLKGDIILPQIGFNTLLFGNDKENFLDLAIYFDHTERRRISHTGEKEDVINEILLYAGNRGADAQRPYLPGMLPIAVDEMLENAFMAAPMFIRQALGDVQKGQRRPLADAEQVEICYGINQQVLGISVSDPWGRFTPDIMMKGFERYLRGGEIEAGVGGGGLYLLWRFCDYLHVHVIPGKRTIFTIFYSITDHIDPETDKSFQFTFFSHAVKQNEFIPL